jgi:hypothetical protein
VYLAIVQIALFRIPERRCSTWLLFGHATATFASATIFAAMHMKLNEIMFFTCEEIVLQPSHFTKIDLTAVGFATLTVLLEDGILVCFTAHTRLVDSHQSLSDV